MASTQWTKKLIDELNIAFNKISDTAILFANAMETIEERIVSFCEVSVDTSAVLGKLANGISVVNDLREGLDNFRGEIDAVIEPGVHFETALVKTSNKLALSGERLDEVSDKARELAVAFGTEATENLGMFTHILSRVGTEMADQPEVLEAMGTSAIRLSKIMNGDVNGATTALTAVFEAFKPSVMDGADATKLMNEQMNFIGRMAQIDADKIPEVTESLAGFGLAAQGANVSFAETVSALQVLGQSTDVTGQTSASLHNIFSNLAAPTVELAEALQGAGVDLDLISNKTEPFANRLEALIPIMNDQKVMAQLFGYENIEVGKTLLDNTNQLREWTWGVENSQSAVNQASAVMGTYAEEQKQANSVITDLKISLFELIDPVMPLINTLSSFLDILSILGSVVWSVGQLMTISGVKMAISWVASMAKIVFSTITSASAISAAIHSIPIIGWIALAITAITALVAYLWDKFGEVRAFFYGLWNFIKVIFTEYYKFIFNVMQAIVEVLNPMNWFDSDFRFGDVWDKLANQAVEGGKKVGSAFSDGWKSGMTEFEQEKTLKKKQEEANVLPFVPANFATELKKTEGSNQTLIKQKDALGSEEKRSTEARGITMNVTMHNDFRVAGNNDVREIVNTMKRELIAVMSDAVPAMG